MCTGVFNIHLIFGMWYDVVRHLVLETFGDSFSASSPFVLYMWDLGRFEELSEGEGGGGKG